jgi:hypothetical protein
VLEEKGLSVERLAHALEEPGGSEDLSFLVILAPDGCDPSERPSRILRLTLRLKAAQMSYRPLRKATTVSGMLDVSFFKIYN